MAAAVPSSPPIGQPMPMSPHAITTSMPTWDAVISWAKREPWMLTLMETGYPRFMICPSIKSVGSATLQRLGIHEDANINTLVFVNGASAARFVKALEEENQYRLPIETVKFSLPESAKAPPIDAVWLVFHTVLYPASLDKEAKAFWRDTGDAISTRHALFLLERMAYLQSTSVNTSYCSSALKRIEDRYPSNSLKTDGTAENNSLREFIARLATSEHPDGPVIKPENVFLYPRGMNAIYAVSRAFFSMKGPSKVIAFGWLYTETTKLIQREAWDSFVYYGHGRAEDLDELEASLAKGERIQGLFCEFPGNPSLVTPDLERIGKLARKYGFIVACDETVSTFVNVDLLRDVDILITSLTKMFSGYCDVMGGSLVINPKSPWYDRIHAQLTALYEETIFPLDAAVLNANSKDFVERLHKGNMHGKTVAEKIAAHPLVAELRYPSMVSTTPLFERYRRQNGGHGYLLSIVFHKEQDAITFYDYLDVNKGTSFGTVFCLAIPFVKLAHYFEQDWVESHGIPRHIVRLSVGLENLDEILKVVDRALEAAEKTSELN